MARGTGTINTLIGDRIGNQGQGWGEDETRANVILQDLMTTACKAEEQNHQLNSQVIASLNEMKRENGFGVSTSVSIANCTGADMKLIREYHHHGHIGRYPVETIVGPGQTAIFIHTKTSFSFYGSKAAFVYQVVTPTMMKHKKDVLLAFDVSWNLLRPRSRHRYAHVEVEKIDHYSTAILSESRHQNRDCLRDRITNGNIKKVENAGLIVEGKIGQAYSPICQFTVKYDFTLGGAAK